jgi:hypothetical protein
VVRERPVARPGGRKIKEIMASADDPVPGSCPLFPSTPDVPSGGGWKCQAGKGYLMRTRDQLYTVREHSGRKS